MMVYRSSERQPVATVSRSWSIYGCLRFVYIHGNLVLIEIKRYRKRKEKSRMDDPETVATSGIQDEDKQTKTYDTEKKP